MSKITQAHGSGGKQTKILIESLFLKYFANEQLSELTDAAVFISRTARLAFTTDSHVVKPIFFPGGDIGRLCVAGTVNDLAVAGAIPRYLSCGFIIEEGFEISALEKIVISMQKTAEEAGVKIIAGDTKVVGRGEADKIFINTSGVGEVPEYVNLSVKNIQAGDKVLLSGNIGEHATAILLARENFAIKADIQSDCASVNALTEKLLQETTTVRIMRDPTRGGVATVLNEFVDHQNFGIRIFEEKIPIRKEIKGLCDPLGLDPLYLANEGKFLFIIGKEEAEEALKILRKEKIGKNAAIIGEVIGKPAGKVLMRTVLGTDRVLNVLNGELLPRIC